MNNLTPFAKQAVVTTYHPPTGFRGARISARCTRGSISIDYPHDLPRDKRHEAAFRALVARFIEEDFKKRGEPRERNPWNVDFASGGMPNGKSEVFVLMERPAA